MLVKESDGFVKIPVVRSRGSDGEVSVKWKTINGTAFSGKDYVGGEGKLIFNHTEVAKELRIELINDLLPEKDESFELEIFEPTGGASIGNVNRIVITISSDDGNNNNFLFWFLIRMFLSIFNKFDTLLLLETLHSE